MLPRALSHRAPSSVASLGSCRGPAWAPRSAGAKTRQELSAALRFLLALAVFVAVLLAAQQFDFGCFGGLNFQGSLKPLSSAERRCSMIFS